MQGAASVLIASARWRSFRGEAASQTGQGGRDKIDIQWFPPATAPTFSVHCTGLVSTDDLFNVQQAAAFTATQAASVILILNSLNW